MRLFGSVGSPVSRMQFFMLPNCSYLLEMTLAVSPFSVQASHLSYLRKPQDEQHERSSWTVEQWWQVLLVMKATKRMLPSTKDMFPEGDFVLQDDNAPCRRENAAQKWFASRDIMLLQRHA